MHQFQQQLPLTCAEANAHGWERLAAFKQRSVKMPPDQGMHIQMPRQAFSIVSFAHFRWPSWPLLMFLMTLRSNLVACRHLRALRCAVARVC